MTLERELSQLAAPPRNRLLRIIRWRSILVVGTSRCDVLARVVAGETMRGHRQIFAPHPCAAERGADSAARRPYLIRKPAVISATLPYRMDVV